MLPDTPSATFPYRILARVGAGAMGEVYEAEDIELGRKVAIKVIKASFVESLPERDAEDALRRFVQEARAAAAFSHPGVTVVHRVGTEGGWPYIAMEWLDGRTLEAVLAEHQRLSVEQTARVGLEVLSVLEAAHRTGITHRDVKPANLMVTRDRRIKVTDFGIARVQGSNLAHTQVGQVLGTPQYAAPEQLAGRPIDVRADLYSVGAVLYECVVGRPPFEAESLYELMSKVQAERPLPASRQVAGVSAEFDALLAKALAKDPDARFPSAREMARALQPFLATRPAASVAGPQAPVSGSGATLLRAPTLHVDGTSPHAIVGEVIRGWPSRALGRQDVPRLLERLFDRPLHAPAFCGAVELSGAVALICDGVLFQAFDVASGASGDAIIEKLPGAADVTLFSCPPNLEPRAVALLASLLAPSAPRLSGLDAAIVDVRQLATRLEGEGFDGTVRLRRNDQVAFLLFSKGKRILEVFGSGWPRAADGTRWEDWVAATGATVSVEDRRNAFPAITYRQQLREFALEVVRATEASPNAARSDSRAQAQMLQLLAATSVTSELPAESVVRSLLDADPALGLARWLLVDVTHQFEQFRRMSKWRAMIEPLGAVTSVKLHHTLAVPDSNVGAFDAVTFGPDGNALHVIERIAVGSAESVRAFVARLSSAAAAPRSKLAGGILVAPRFDDHALDAYGEALRASRKSALRAALDLLTHREGYLTTQRGGCHVLLVEEDADGRKRPLVPEES